MINYPTARSFSCDSQQDLRFSSLYVVIMNFDDSILVQLFIIIIFF
ncbi:hypothetical protein Hanom_Chr05g00468421 [Helianthus anomalus]